MSDRGHRGDGYVLLTPANRYASQVPWLPDALVYKLVSPRLEPAAFSQQLICLDHAPRAPAVLPSTASSSSTCCRASCERASTVPDTTCRLGASSTARRQRARAGGRDGRPRDPDPPRVVSARRRWSARATRGHRDDCEPNETGVPGLVRLELLPTDDPSFDFTMSIMRFAPGAVLDQVEIHDEEHGLYMLEGGGQYLLGSDWHAVSADDFIYMAPYCPQTFVAGADGGEYLLYKDIYRELP